MRIHTAPLALVLSFAIGWLLPEYAAAQTPRPMGYAGAVNAADEDRNVFYSGILNTEIHQGAPPPLATASPERRRAVIDALVAALLQRGELRDYSIFVSGAAADRLVAISQVDQRFANEYRVRAYLAGLVPVLRGLGLLQPPELAAVQSGKFLDLAQALGFTSVAVSDGNRYTLVFGFK